MPKTSYHDLAGLLLSTARRAGQFQLDIRASGFQVDYKGDNSPVSLADTGSERIILEDLARIAPDIPVLAEEAASAGDIPEPGSRFFCVDPLDGTKEFINNRDEFTVNIALVECGTPVFGLVYAPAVGKLYVTLARDRAVSLSLDAHAPDQPLEGRVLTEIRTRPVPADKGMSVVASRSHMGKETEDYLEGLDIAELRSAGSSLKFCLVAAGEADLYPRFGPTMEWDTAAGHAIVLAAGGSVVTGDGAPLVYGKNGGMARPFLNPSFIVRGSEL